MRSGSRGGWKARPAMWPAAILGVAVLLGTIGCSEECTHSSECGECRQCVRGSCSAIPGCPFDGGTDADADGGADADPDADPDAEIIDVGDDGVGPDGDDGADGDADDGGDIPDVPVVCGNEYCQEGENCATCEADCDPCPGCGNGICEDTVESPWDCPEDCGDPPPICGNGVCEVGESSDTCAYDCPVGPGCGDGVCTAGTESCTSCPADCPACPPVCPNGVVETGEECDDGNAVDGDGCQRGCTFTCHTGDPCTDGDPCTENFCDTATHLCGARPGEDGVPCGTGDICTGFGTCLAGSCYSSTALDCDDGEACTTDTCAPVVGCIHTDWPDGTSCVDPFYCITGETCRRGLDLVLHCRGDLGTSPCNDGNVCTVDVCDEAGDSCSYEPPTYRDVACGSGSGGSAASRPNDYRNLVCPDGTHSAPGADVISQVTVAAAGTLSVTLNAADTAPGTTVYLLSNACLMSSCLANSTTTASASVTAGTYYIVVDSTVGGDIYDFTVTCP